jgi:carbon storage regulator
MLVLSRKCGEKIVLPEQNIVLMVLEVRGEQVRLGISAPSDVPIYREEIWERIKSFADLEAPEPLLNPVSAVGQCR